jgi:hypothetical protein
VVCFSHLHQADKTEFSCSLAIARRIDMASLSRHRDDPGQWRQYRRAGRSSVAVPDH